MRIRKSLLGLFWSSGIALASHRISEIDWDTITLSDLHDVVEPYFPELLPNRTLINRAAPEDLIGNQLFMNGEYHGVIKDHDHARKVIYFHNHGEYLNSLDIDRHLEALSKQVDLKDHLRDAARVSKRGGPPPPPKKTTPLTAAQKAAKEKAAAKKAAASAAQAKKFTDGLANKEAGASLRTKNQANAEKFFANLQAAAYLKKFGKVLGAAKAQQAKIAQEKALGDHGCIHYIDPAHPCCDWYQQRGIDVCFAGNAATTNHYYNSKTFMKCMTAKINGDPCKNWDPKVEQQQWFKDHPGDKCNDDQLFGSPPCTNPSAEWFKDHPYGSYGLTPNVGANGGSGADGGAQVGDQH